MRLHRVLNLILKDNKDPFIFFVEYLHRIAQEPESYILVYENRCIQGAKIGLARECREQIVK